MINIEEKKLEILRHIEGKYRITMRMDVESISRTNENLKSKGFNILVMYEFAFRENGTSTRIPCICLDDGYISYYQSTHILNGKIRCEGCRVESYKSNSEKIGFNYVSHRAEPNTCFVTISCNKDGTKKEVTSSEIFSGNNISCLTCTTNKYKELALTCGFEYMSHHINSSRKHILLRCSEDGYFRTIGSSELHEAKAKCPVCNVNKYKVYLATKNCTYVDHKPNKVTVNITYLNEFGESFEVNCGNLFRNKFAVTKETHWNQKHSVYCIEANDGTTGYIKIGTANSPDQRLKDIKLKCESTVSTLAEFSDRYQAKALESELHFKLSEHKVEPKDVQHIIGKQISRKRVTGDRVKVKDGVTEWFYSSAIPLLKELGYLK